MTNFTKPVDILLVEDNPSDVRLIQEAFQEAQLDVNLRVAKDGAEAIAFFQSPLADADEFLPELVILDLNLPKRSGREVLAKLKSESSTRPIPVVMLTTSNAQNDVADCYQLHANCYIIKPLDFEEFVQVVHSIERFWLNTVRLPR